MLRAKFADFENIQIDSQIERGINVDALGGSSKSHVDIYIPVVK